MSPSSTPDSRPKPTLEELLRLKRSERPDTAFWQEFERGMRQKQLAAIVEPRPWWLGAVLLGRRVVPLGLPVSAAAAAMLALVIMRVSPFGGVAQAPARSTSEPAAVAVAVADRALSVAGVHSSLGATPASELHVVAALVSPSSPVDGGARAMGVQPATVSPALDTSTSLAMTNEVSGKSPGVVVPPEVDLGSAIGTVSALSSPQVLIASTRDQGVADMSGATFEADAGGLQPEQPVMDARHARLLTGMGEFDDGRSLAKVRDRVTHRLADDEARYASVSRVGVNADRLSLKF
jgi:hypothetical protein